MKWMGDPSMGYDRLSRKDRDMQRRAAGRRCYMVEVDELGLEIFLGELGYAVSNHAQTGKT